MPYTSNIDAYTANLHGRIAAMQREAKTLTIKAGSELFRGTQDRTPVDTGRAKASWRSHALDDYTWQVISEGVPYIGMLEFGGYAGPGPKTQPAPGGEPAMVSNVTRQAPHGMLRLTLLDIREVYLRDLGVALATSWRSG